MLYLFKLSQACERLASFAPATHLHGAKEPLVLVTMSN